MSRQGQTPVLRLILPVYCPSDDKLDNVRLRLTNAKMALRGEQVQNPKSSGVNKEHIPIIRRR